MRVWASVLGVTAAAVLAAGGARAQHLVMAPSSVIPAASIHLDLGKDGNGNTTVDLKATHLAQPSSLSPAKSVYVVWAQQTGEAPEREGLLTVDQNLNGELKFVTPARHFQLFITAEDSPTTTTPSGTEVIRGSIARAGK